MSALTASHEPSLTAIDYDPFAGGALARVVPSTGPQREVWLADRFGIDASLAFNESVCLHLRGALDSAALIAAVESLVARRDALRAVFAPDGESLCILARWGGAVHCEDWSARPVSAAREALQARRRAAVDVAFDLRNGPLFRAELLTVAADEHALLLTAHHIVCDGWSWWLLVRELAALYAAHAAGVEPALPSAAAFTDYALAQAGSTTVAQRRRDEAYWLAQFADPPPSLELPTDRPRPARRSYASARVDHLVDAEVIGALRRTGARVGASLFATLLSGFASLLSRLSGQDDLVVAIPAAGQSIDGNDDVLGHCVHTLPLRFRLDARASVNAAIGQAQTLLLDAIEHQHCTFGEWLPRLALARDPARPPLVSVMFNIDQALDREAAAFPGLSLDFQSNARSHENFELFINAVQVDGALRLECQYNTDLFDAQGIRGWLHGLQTLLAGMAAQPEATLLTLDWLAADERAALCALQPPPSDYACDRLMHQHFERQCARAPQRIALHAADGELTYAELDARANRIAHLLRRHGVHRGALVGIALDRGCDLMAAWLGVLKSGAGYVPLDPGFPQARLADMVADAGLAALLTQSAHVGRFDLRGRPVLALDAIGDELAALPAGAPDSDADGAEPESVAYVIYTSGSTGKPKGVAIPHRAVANFIAAMQAEPGMPEDASLAAVTTLSFDIAVLEWLLPLSVGARVLLLDREVAMDGVALMRALEQHAVRVMQATPATWRVLIEAGWRGAPGFTVLCGGEPLSADLAAALRARCGTLWNLYGPTETTIWSTAARIEMPAGQGSVDVHIGRPIANTEVWILDAQGQPCPRGVPGELCIGGDGLALGYLHRPELTAERFIEASFAGPRSRRLYRTGDRARWRRDGNLQHLGRLDFQVKVRGYRIELGDVEAALLAQPEVANAVAMVREDRPGDARLVAYAVARAAGCDEGMLAERLRELLPDYMRPQHIVLLERMPSLPNGKLDRKALSAPINTGKGVAADDDAHKRAPADPVEAGVLAAMAEVLGNPALGPDDDFFAAGGHSLLAAQLTARLNREFAIGLSLRALFDHPSAAALAVHLRGVAAPALPAIRRRTEQGFAPLSVMQERMRLLDAFNPGQLGYNLPSAHRLRGALDVPALDRALRALAQRQTVLRTMIDSVDGEPMQRIVPEVEFGLLNVDDLRDLPEAQREPLLHARMRALIEQPFASLAQAPLVRTRLYRLADDEYVLFFMAHHIIWDGWSFDLLYSELSELYAAQIEARSPVLPDLPVSYGDFAHWQLAFRQGDEYARQLAWWRAQLARPGGEPGGAPLPLPTDMPRQRGMSGRSDAVPLVLREPLAEAMQRVARQFDVTVFNLLLSAWFVALAAFGGRRDLIVGTPVRGRNSAESEPLMGYFTNLLPLRVDVEPTLDFHRFNRIVRDVVLDSFAHPDVQIDDLAGTANPGGKRHAVLYHALFSYQDIRQRATHWGNVEHSRVEVFQPGATEDLGLWLIAHEHGLNGGLIYNADIFHAATQQSLIACYQTILEAVAAEPGAALASLLERAAREFSATAAFAADDVVATASHGDGQAGESATPVPPAVDARMHYLAGVWSDVLGGVEVSVEDNFFDLGGNSMQAAHMAERVYRDTGYRIKLLRLAAQSVAQIAEDLPAAKAVPAMMSVKHRPLSAQGGSAPRLPAHHLAWLEVGERRLLTMITPPEQAVRGVLLMCAPLLQEHVRSYRLFALLAQALAARGVWVLRFDYHGSGDSSGDSSEFSIAGAVRDAIAVYEHARARHPDVAIAALGISAGAFVADRLTRDRGCRLLLWQPVRDGSAWVDAQIAADARERSSTNRFPFLRAGQAIDVGEHDLLGFPLADGVLDELRACRLHPDRLESAVVLDRADATIFLPESIAGWIGQIDIQEYFRALDVDGVAAALADAIGWSGR